MCYCKIKLNPGTENQRKPFHAVQKKKKKSFSERNRLQKINFCNKPVCNVA